MEMQTKSRMFTRTYSLKAILLGDSGVGKSTLMETYCLPKLQGPLMFGSLRRSASLMMEEVTLSRGQDTVIMRLMDTGGNL